MAFRGRDIKLQVKVATVWTTVALMRSRTISISNDAVDITSDDALGWTTLLGDTGARAVGLSGGAVFSDAASLEILQDASYSDTPVEIKLVFPNVTELTGFFHVSNFEIAAEHLDAVAATFTLASTAAQAITLPPAVLTELFDFTTLDASVVSVVALSVHPTIPTTMYALVLVGSAHRFAVSTDQGVSWALVGNTLSTGNSTPQHSILRTDDGIMLAVHNANVVSRSLDDGVTWASVLTNSLLSNLIQPGANKILVGSQTFPGEFLADSTPYNAFVSTPAVTSRNPLAFGNNGTTICAVGGYIAGTEGASFWRSTDEGATWAHHFAGAGEMISSSSQLIYGSMTYVNGVWYATAPIAGGSAPSVTYKSVDDGVTFTKVQSAGTLTVHRMSPFTSRDNFIYGVGSDTGASNRAVFVTSQDEGVSWSVVHRPAGGTADVMKDIMEVGGKLYFSGVGTNVNKLFTYG